MSDHVRVHLADPDFRRRDCPVRFTLLYEGELKTGKGGGRGARIHRIRQCFHHQLKRLWKTNHLLSNWILSLDGGSDLHSMKEFLPNYFDSIGNYRFLPIVNPYINVDCSLDFRLLRPTDIPGQVTDIDNQIKVLCDALKRPSGLDEMGNPSGPDDGEEPFYVLAHDDGLFSKITSTSGELLQPVNGKSDYSPTDVRVFVDVCIRPSSPSIDNAIFYHEENYSFDHEKFSRTGYELSLLNTSELRHCVSQCVFRIWALCDSFSLWERSEVTERFTTGLSRDDLADSYFGGIYERRKIWEIGQRPTAIALRDELLNRVFGEGPYPDEYDCSSLNEVGQASLRSLHSAADILQKLSRRL